MSKKRPSAVAGRRRISVSAPVIKGQLGYWNRRVFKNTFTRNGRRFTVDKWCVKIQHAGRRRTFSLSAVTRRQASDEARKLYFALVKRGWEKVENDAGSSQERRPKKLSVQYWKQALIRRSCPATTDKTIWSAWLEHEGAGYYFRLRSDSMDKAAAEALRIYRKIRTMGWPAVFKLHPREATVALHWTDNPLAWTYTTFPTLLRRSRRITRHADAATAQPAWRVVVLEAERGVRQVMEFYINRHPGFDCVAAFEDIESTLAWMRSGNAGLILANENLPGSAKLLSDLQTAFPGTLAMLFSVYSDSAQLFKCSPGGAVGYLFKRTPPERMLEPLIDVRVPNSPPPQYLSGVARNYFQGVLSRLELKPSGKLASLTPRENQILDYLSKGCLDKEIAAAVGISTWTVHGHLKNIFEKLQVHNRLEAVLKYLNK